MTSTQPTGFTDAAETWNRRFDGDDFVFGTEPNIWLRQHVYRRIRQHNRFAGRV